MKTQFDSNEKYHSSPGISASGLKAIYKKSVYHFLNQKPFETSSMALGTAVHCAMLEPEMYHKEFHIMPKIDRRTKQGKEQFEIEQKKAKNKKLVSFDDHQKITKILENFKNHELAQKYCQGQIELSHYGKLENLDVRVRPDCLNRVEGFISDVKTCQDNSPNAFKRDVYKYAYHLQAAFYMDMCNIDKFKFIAVETNFPFSVEVYTLSDEMIEQGRKAWKRAFDDWKIYCDMGIISGYIWNNFDNDGSLIL
ncbi:MAG: putative exodeoxyribonuclease 8 [Prokaryotic dsDNA virus sp.]|jgi:exodeoxyribonuclease VIII|nr:MAG: putative exodeoxyribonuclease 8 [Prokaryotic dsDNA virus sp.]|tara:strand:+ start:934 stop:1689 length:756 start_codon:yes stop_codon:yes gene_type:complete